MKEEVFEGGRRGGCVSVYIAYTYWFKLTEVSYIQGEGSYIALN